MKPSAESDQKVEGWFLPSAAAHYARKSPGSAVAQVSQPAVSPISKSAGLARSTISGFGNPRYSRLGSRRYGGDAKTHLALSAGHRFPFHCAPLLVLAMLLFAFNLRAADLVPGFDAANKLYEEGKYADAVTAYDKLLESGASAAIYYNRGNALFKLNQLGRAIGSYRQAQSLAPRDSNLRANLQSARTRARGGTPFHAERWRVWLDQLTLNEWTLLTALMLWLLFLLLALTQWRPALRSALGKYILGAGAGALLFGLCLAIQLDAGYFTRSAIVIAGEADVRNGPLDEAAPVYKVRDGLELNILDEKDNWLQVRDPAQRLGWVRRDQVMVVEPAGSAKTKS